MTELSSLNAGHGGETHQAADADHPVLTTNHGTPVSDNQNQLKAGPRGPVLLEDEVYREKINHFDHERIPERIVHARGSAAHGYFECTDSLADVTVADLFKKKGQRTEVFVRFSTVAGGAGSIDTPRDVRGFAVKFYTREGNWDLVGNNIPVSYPGCDQVPGPDPRRQDGGRPRLPAGGHRPRHVLGLHQPDARIDPHDHVGHVGRTLPRTFANMEGFGVHTFRFIDKKGKSTFVKFHWKPKAGLASTIWDETVKIAGRTRTSSVATCSNGSGAATTRPGNSACSCSTRRSPRASPTTSSTRPRSSLRRCCRSGSSGAWCSTATPTTSSRRPNRRPLCRATSCRASASRTIHCFRGGCSATRTRSCRAWAR